MSALPQVAHLPVSFDPYIRQGWHLVPIAIGSKGPRTPGWNKKENTITDPNMIPKGYGVGLAHAYSGTMALDIDDANRSIEELRKHGIELEQLYTAPDAVTINSGNPGHGKLLYRMPFGLVLNSKKLMDTRPDGSKYNYLDFRCATANGLTCQDVLPPSIHPVTCKPYQWGGKGRWENLPYIPAALLDVWQSHLEADNVRSIKVVNTPNSSWTEIDAALECIPADIDRTDWINVGMALHQADPEVGLSKWDTWSSQGTKYQGQRDILNCWRSFKQSPDGVKLGTLFKIAKEYGYTRPSVDASALFAAVTPVTPLELFDLLVTPPPELNLDLFPPVLAQRASELSSSIGCDPIVPIWAGLGAVCAVADSRSRLTLMDGWTVPPVLWLMTIGDPSEKKTPGAEPMLQVLKDLQAEDRPRFADELLQWEAHEGAHAASKKEYLKMAADPTLMLGGQLNVAALPIVHALPAKPVPLRLTVDDVTSQKLMRMVADRPRGVLCSLDEMASWINKVTDPRSGDDRSTWTKGYEAKPQDMDRVGDGKGEGHIHVENFAVAMFGNIQPKVFSANIDRMSTDGMLQRFIPAVIRSRYRKRNEPISDWMTNRAQYEQAIRRVYATPKTDYRMSPEAYDAFRAFQTWYEQVLQDEKVLGASDTYLNAFGKLEGTCGRLILVTHLLLDPYQLDVSGNTATKAIEIVKTYIVPALRHALGEIAGYTKDTLDHWVFEYIIQMSGEQSEVTLSEIKRSARRRLEGKPSWLADNLVKDAMHQVERHGYATITHSDNKTTIWALNANVAAMYADHRVKVIKAKQRRIDERVMLSGGKITRTFTRGYDPATMDEPQQ